MSKMLEELAALEILARLPNDVVLTSAEAAVFLRLSLSTLERMRRDGSGPIYVQGGKAGARGTNQKCLYKKQALIDWLQANEVASSMVAAVRKGQTFVALQDILVAVPVWRDPNGLVAGLVEKTPVDVCVERLGVWEIEWMPASEAACETWSSLGDHAGFADQIQQVLKRESQRIRQAEEGTEIASAMEPKLADKKNKPATVSPSQARLIF